MISEKKVVADFKGFWSESLPLLTPSFVKVFNEVSADDLTKYPDSQIVSVPIGPAVVKHDLVAEFSFQLAKVAHESSLWVDEIRLDKGKIKDAYNATISFLQKYKNDNGEFALSDEEMEEGFLLAEQYDYFLEMNKGALIEFSPEVSGAGFLGKCKADLSVGETLYEVKTVSRNISGNDIKQLIIYLALQFSAGQRRWTHAGFFNPRRARCFKFSVDHLIYRTSGGKQTPELFSDIIDFLNSRGVELDTSF